MPCCNDNLGKRQFKQMIISNRILRYRDLLYPGCRQAAATLAEALKTELSTMRTLPPGHFMGCRSIIRSAPRRSGGVFVALAASLGSTNALPIAGLSLVLGVDRFMSEARALVNVIGCFVGTIVVGTWEGEFDLARGRAVLADRENYDRTSEAARPSPHDFACSRHTDR
jgi:aerobic C4-dicarboxylate transport protein